MEQLNNRELLKLIDQIEENINNGFVEMKEKMFFSEDNKIHSTKIENKIFYYTILRNLTTQDDIQKLVRNFQSIEKEYCLEFLNELRNKIVY